MLKDLVKKDFRTGGLFFVCGILYLLAFSCSQGSEQTQESILIASLDSTLDSVIIISAEPMDNISDSIPERPEQEKKLHIIGVGDMMLGTNYPYDSYLPANGGKELLADVNDILNAADLTFGNLEGTILNSGGTPKKCKNPDLCYVFRSPENYVDHFSKAGFDVLSLANNHSGDFGATGRSKTKAVLKEAGIEFAGLEGTDEFALFEKGGLTYGFCAFAPNVGTCDIRNISRAKQIVGKLEEQADIVIVSFHGGAEGAKHQSVPKKTETYYGENRGNVYEFAHAVVDAGADIVFGHGPHVTRALELYQDRFIIYSLG